MLLGTEIGAALTALEPFDVDVIGIELRDRTEGDERCGPLSGAEFDQGSFGACRMRACRRTRAATPSTSCRRRNWPSITSIS